MKKLLLNLLSLVVLLLAGTVVFAQVPVISYTGSPYTYNVNTAITALTVSNTGGSVAGGYTTVASYSTPATAPYCVTSDATGVSYAISAGSKRVYRIGLTGTATIMTYTATSPLSATLKDIAIDGSGNLYVSDVGNGEVFKFTIAGNVLTLAATIGTDAVGNIYKPYGITFDSANNVYVADLQGGGATAGVIFEIAAGTTTVSSFATGLNNPGGVAFDGSSNLYVSEPASNKIIKIVSGVQSTYAGTFSTPSYLSSDGLGNVYEVDNGSNSIKEISAAGVLSTMITSGLNTPVKVSFDGATPKNLYEADYGSGNVNKSSPTTYYTISPALPAGLTFNATTGGISGTPTGVSVATNYTITGYNSSGNGSTIINITVNPQVPIFSYTTPDTYTINTAITALAPANTGGTPVSYAVSGTALPAGLTLNTTNGQITGTPTTITTAANYSITATNTGGTGTTMVTITVVNPPGFTYTGPNVYTTNTAITALSPTITSDGPLTGATISPALPAGLSISAAGVISGTPTAVTASATYTITATGANGGVGTATVGITVVNPPSFSYAGPDIYTRNLAITALSPTITSDGPLTGATISPTLPTGLSISTAGVISGTPTAAQAVTTYTITATGADGGVGTATVNIAVVLPPAFTYTGPNVYTTNRAITALSPTITARGPLTGATISPALPTGLTISAAGVISGTATAISSATTYTITAIGSTGGTGTATVVISVVNPPGFTYTGPNVYTTNVAITALSPTITSDGPLTGATISPALPTGLALSAAGVISGTPTAVTASATYTITATGADGGVGTATVGITVVNPPSFSYAGPDIYTKSLAINALSPTITSDGPLTGATISPVLPAGLAISAAGVISGTPTALSAAATYTVTATGADGGVGTATVTISVVQPPAFTYTGPNVYTTSRAITALSPTITARGPLTGATISPALPTGLTISAAGVISGTATAISGATTYTITATGSTGGTGTATVVISVVNPPGFTYTGPNVYTTNIAITALSPTITSDGPLTGATISPALPTGLALSAAGVISGTPTAVTASATYTITATGADGGVGTATVGITVVNPPVFAYAGPDIYTRNVAITALSPTITSDGPLTGATISPTLPTGLSISAAGVISGTPTALSAAATYTVTATGADGGVGTATVTISVVQPPAFTYTGPNVYTTNLAITALSPTITARGPLTGATISPALPAGLTISAAGVISGTPTAIAASTTYTITAIGSTGGAGTATVVISVVNPPGFTYAGPNVYTTNTAITALSPTITSDGPLTGATISPALPAGLTISAAGVISGTPTAVTASATYTITATGADGGVGTAAVGITVVNPPVFSYAGPDIYTRNVTINPLSPTVTSDGPLTGATINPALPTGLSISAAGVISGTATVFQNATTYAITATGADGGVGTATVNITVVVPPAFTYTGPNVYTTNLAITALSPTVTLRGPLTGATISPALPTGLTISATGVISGTATVISAATTYTITATGSTGGTGTATVVISVVNPPGFTYTGPDVYTTNTAITALSPTITSDGPLTGATISPALPAGLSISAAGVISGTPTAVSASATYTITATGADGGVGSATVAITVVSPPAFSYSGPDIYTVNTAITTLSPTITSDGPLTGATVSPALPAGFSISAAGVISGTPTATSAAVTYTITATGADGGVGKATVVISVVNPPVFSYTSNSYTVGVAIATLSPTITSGGPLTGATINPALPAGLAMSTAGVITGTPTAASAITTYTVSATGSAGGVGTASFSITVVNPAIPVISYTTPDSYPTTVAITALTPTNTGGAAVSYAVSGTALPAGLTLNTTTGQITGTPTTITAAANYGITATNPGGTSAVFNINITILGPPPSISYTPSTNVFPVGTAIASLAPTNTGGAVPASGFGPGTVISSTTFANPDGMAFDASGNLYVTENAARTRELNSSLGYVGPFATRQSTPVGIVFDSSGNAYILDNGTGLVYQYNSAGTLLATLSPGGGFTNPYAIAINSSNDLFVADYGTDIVTEFNTSGTVLATFTTKVTKPTGIAVDPSGNIYVLNSNVAENRSVTVYNANGVYQYIFVTGLSQPSAIATDAEGNVYVGDTGTGTVTEYNPGGTVLATITGFGTPAGIVTDSKGNLYVSDNTNNTVTVYPPIGGYYLSGALPPGISFDGRTGTFSGTPTSAFPPTTYTVTCYNSSGSSSTTVTFSCTTTPFAFSYSPSTNTYLAGQAVVSLSPTITSGSISSLSYSTGTSITGGTLDGATGIGIDPTTGNMYVVNYTNNTILEYSSSGAYITSITVPATTCGIVFDSSGDAFIISTAGSVYKYTGGFGGTQSTFLTGLSDIGASILGIAIDASGNIYVTSANGATSSAVFKYAGTGTTAGAALLTISTNLDNPSGVAVDASGNIYVSNYAGAAKIYEFNSTGTTSTQLVPATTITKPFGIAVSATGLVYVAGKGGNVIDVINPATNTLVTSFSSNNPGGVAIESNGDVITGDYTNNVLLQYMPYSGYYLSGILPAGLSFNTTTGTFSGTPTAAYPTTTLTVSAYSDGTKSTTTVTFTCYVLYDWTGALSSDWNATGNWESGIVPDSTKTANIGVNYAFTNPPVVSLSGATTVKVGAIVFGNKGGNAAGVSVSSGYTLAVIGDITKQSDANSTLGYVSYLSGAGTITAVNLNVLANTTAASTYTESITASVTSLQLSGNVALTSTNSTNAANAAFYLTGGITSVTGTLTSTNVAGSSSTFSVNPTTTATLQLANATPLSGLSATGTNVVSILNAGATVEYSGAAQTVYTDLGVTGLAGGLSYQNIKFSGTGIKTPNGTSANNLNISGDFTNALTLNDAGDYVNLASSIVNFTGVTQNIYAGNGTGTTFYTLNFKGTGTTTIQSGEAYLATTGTLAMSGGSAVLAAGGLLTLNSSATSSATVAQIPAGCSITGTVNVQRELGTKRGYRLLSSPVYGSTANSNNIYSINYLINSCYVKGTTGTAGGFDAAGNPNIYLFRENLAPSNATFTSGNFRGINTLGFAPNFNYLIDGDAGTFNIPAGDGYMFFYRGNRAAATLTAESVLNYVPTSTALTASGTLNQGTVTAVDWYTPTSAYMGFTTTSGNTNVQGFNLVGNPYASSIDWNQYNTSSTTTGIYTNNIANYIYELDPTTNNYDIYEVGGIFTNNGTNIIASGQGFFVVALNSSGPQIIFNESAKTASQNTGTPLFMDRRVNNVRSSFNAAPLPHLRLQMEMDSVNKDDIYLGFDASAKNEFSADEDAPYKTGNGQVGISSFSSDNVSLAINRMPFPKLQRLVIPLAVHAAVDGNYNINLKEQTAIPALFDVWLMDAYQKDSLDIKSNPTYAFTLLESDTNTYGSHRFSLVIEENPSLMVHLLNFTALKVNTTAQVNWVTENEANYTSFTVERSSDGGTTYTDLGSIASSGLGTYSYLDQMPPLGKDMYRLKIEDLNGTISYSSVVVLSFANTNNQVAINGMMVYPNPTAGSLNVSITNQTVAASTTTTTTTPAYNIEIVNNIGSVIKTAQSGSPLWQTDVSSLIPGTYFIRVINTANNSVVGKTAFVKL